MYVLLALNLLVDVQSVSVTGLFCSPFVGSRVPLPCISIHMSLVLQILRYRLSLVAYLFSLAHPVAVNCVLL
jgi:hypothetical protein